MRDHENDITGLSARHQRILALGVSGGDEDETPETPPAETPPEAPAETPPADAPAETPAEGGDAPEGDAAPAEASIELPEPVADLAAAEEQALRDEHEALEAVVQTNMATATSAEQVAVLEQARERQTAIVAEITRRRELAADLTRRLESLGEGAAPLPDAQPVPALASAAAIVAGRTAQPAAHVESPASRAPRPRVALVAAAGANVLAAGSEMSLAELGEAIDATKSGDAGKALLASIPAFEAMGVDDQLPAMLSRSNTWETNNELIREAQADFMALRGGETPAARTAAICEPLDIIREIPDGFSATEVVSPELPSRPAGRLGFQHSRSIDLADVLAGVVLWDETDQSGVDPDDPSTWKPCVEVECPTPVSVKAEAVAACLQFDITTEMSNPETVRNYMNALDAQRARIKEARVLNRLDVLSSRYTFGGSYGALPTLIETVNEAVARAVFANRQDDPSYTLFINPLTAALLRIDRANRAFGANCESCDVLDQFRDQLEGVSQVVTTLDRSSEAGGNAEPGLPPAALNPVGDAPVALTQSNGTHRIRLIDPRSFIYAETGKRDTGVQRSPELARQNRAQLFGEEFFYLDLTGPWANFSIDVNLCDDGGRAGFLEPHNCGQIAAS